MTKPIFNKVEAHDLLCDLEKISDANIRVNLVKESLSAFILKDDTNENRFLKAHSDIQHEIYKMKHELTELNRILRTMYQDIKEAPKHINDTDPIISTIARWRLKVGK